MAFINYSKREVQFKVVYGGAPGCGKDTNLVSLRQLVDDPKKSDVEESDLAGSRLLSVYFYSLFVNAIEGFQIRFQVCALSGIATHESVRQILKGVDALVMVVDSSFDKMADNVSAFNALQESLVQNHVSLAQIPHVIQYNKRDLENAAPIYFLDYTFNNRVKRAHTVEACAQVGAGVVETFDAVTRLLLAKYSPSQT